MLWPGKFPFFGYLSKLPTLAVAEFRAERTVRPESPANAEDFSKRLETAISAPGTGILYFGMALPDTRGPLSSEDGKDLENSGVVDHPFLGSAVLPRPKANTFELHRHLLPQLFATSTNSQTTHRLVDFAHAKS